MHCLHVFIVHTRLVQCWSDTKASLIDETKRGNVRAKSENAELMLKKELVSPQKPSFCSRPSNSEPLCLFPGIENSSLWYQLAQDFFYETLYPSESKRVCFACMINTRWWEREGNGAKREQYLDWWNKNWLETRLSQNPLVFFVCSLSFFPFAGFNVGCIKNMHYFKCLKRKSLLSANFSS